MLSKKEDEKVSKFMSYVLRHAPGDIGMTLDENGWVSVDELVFRAQKVMPLTQKMVEFVVKNNVKQRFCLSEDGKMIRANQGHTVKVDLDLPDVEPPEYLYHGTAEQFMESISKEGLKPMKRHDVHLSFSEETAYKVAVRHGKPVILVVEAGRMYRQGYRFQCTKNNVWLTEKVPAKFFIIQPAKKLAKK
jgi:putative RNA 2'-phosphotransferase